MITKLKINIIFLSLFFLCMTGKGFAEDIETVDCNNTQSLDDRKYCSEQSLEQAEKEFYQTYFNITKDLEKRVEDEEDEGRREIYDQNFKYSVEILNSMKENWMTYRDEWCEFTLLDFFGSAAYSLDLTMCREQLTREHIDWLKKNYQKP